MSIAKRHEVKQCLSRKKPGIETGSSGCASECACMHASVFSSVGTSMLVYKLERTNTTTENECT